MWEYGDRYEEMRRAERRNPFRECRDAHVVKIAAAAAASIPGESNSNPLRNEVILTLKQHLVR